MTNIWYYGIAISAQAFCGVCVIVWLCASAMAMNLVKEVRSVIAFFKARQGPPITEDADANLRNSFVNALRVQINALPALAPADAAQLNEVLKDSPFGVEGAAKIVEAIVAKLHQLSPQARRLPRLLTALEVSLELPSAG